MNMAFAVFLLEEKETFLVGEKINALFTESFAEGIEAGIVRPDINVAAAIISM